MDVDGWTMRDTALSVMQTGTATHQGNGAVFELNAREGLRFFFFRCKPKELFLIAFQDGPK